MALRWACLDNVLTFVHTPKTIKNLQYPVVLLLAVGSFQSLNLILTVRNSQLVFLMVTYAVPIQDIYAEQLSIDNHSPL